MSTRKILALLVVLALGLSLCSIPAGSATLQRSTGSENCSVTGGPTFKDGDGEDVDGGDDDRWGNESVGGPPDESSGGHASGDDDENGEEDCFQVLGRTGLIRIELRALLGLLVIML